MERQLVLTYVTLLRSEPNYTVQVEYEGETGSVESGAVMTETSLEGDIRAGQISLSTTGIFDDSAEVCVRAEYVPRNISRFRFRLETTPDIEIHEDDIELAGLLSENWRLMEEGNNIFYVLTDEADFIPYGSFGDIMKITFDGVSTAFEVSLRLDNSIYSAPPNTTFFQYPLENLVVQPNESDIIAVPQDDIYVVADDFNPDAAGAFDSDGDGTRDFDDPQPLNPDYPVPFADPTFINFDLTGTDAEIVLTNQRYDDIDWRVLGLPEWISVTPTTGSVNVGATSSVTVTADATDLPPAFYDDTFAFELESGVSTQRLNVRVAITREPDLSVTPASVDFADPVTEAQFTIGNTGTSEFEWEVTVEDASNPGATTPPDFMSFTPAFSGTPATLTGTSAGNSTTPISVTIDRDHPDIQIHQTYEYTIYVSAVSPATAVPPSVPRGTVSLPVTITVVGNPQLVVYHDGQELSESQGDSVWMATGIESTDIKLGNTGDDLLTWSLELSHSPVDPEDEVFPIGTLDISATPTEGTIVEDTVPPVYGTQVRIQATQSQLLEVLGEGTHRFRISIDWDRGTRDFYLFIDIKPMPNCVVSPNTLNYGSDPDTIELELEVGNNGAVSSRLNYSFEIEGEDPGTRLVATRLEDVTGVLVRTSPLTYPTDIYKIQIDRTVVDEPVEWRTIIIRDTEIPTVEPVEVGVRVDQTPLFIEGAINRARPPSVVRFVFLLRDRFWNAVPTQTQEDLDKIEFFVYEDDNLLDPYETNRFVRGPQNLKYNLILLLDYTGSMYYAGVDKDQNPLEPGEAISNMRESAKGFVDDLPDGYRIAVMEHHDVVPGIEPIDRYIHGFTTDKEALKSAIDTFSLPTHEHGASDILDALVDATTLIVGEDPQGTIPFDDADVRSVVFITDGYDTSSVNSDTEAAQYAKDNRVRLYPMGYKGGDSVNSSPLVTLATETNGHVYYASDVQSMTRMLANEKGLALGDTSVDGDEVTFDIANAGVEPAPWTLDYDETRLSVAEPHLGTIWPGETHPVVFTPVAGLAEGQYEETVLVESLEHGTAEVTASFFVDGAGAASGMQVSKMDEPGQIWHDLRNQVVLTYISLFQEGSHDYLIKAEYTENDQVYSASFQEDGVYWPGDVRQGQITLRTTGIYYDVDDAAYKAKVYVRTDYVPRNISQFRFRFFTVPPSGLSEVALASLEDYTVEFAPDGLITDWRLIPQGEGVYSMLTEEDNALQFGTFGNLVRLTFEDLTDFVDEFAGLSAEPRFNLGFRVDNTLYYWPAMPPSTPSTTKYFVYPGGPLFATYPDEPGYLQVGFDSDIATPAVNPSDLSTIAIDPEPPEVAWDVDEDGVLAFDDREPFDAETPGSFMAQDTLLIGGTESSGIFTIRNDWFDTLEWEIEDGFPTGFPAWVSDVRVDGVTADQGTILPGRREFIEIVVDRSGLGTGVYESDITLISNLGDGIQETLTLSLIVP